MPKHPSGCRWCGEPITVGRKGRSWHGGKYGEPNCVREFQLHTVRPIQFAFVSERDGLKCWDCSEVPEKWISDRCNHMRGGDPIYVGVFWPIRRGTALELEHMAPLWSVAHLPADERRPFFYVTNLRLRCPTCHAKKSRAESRDRAHVKRLAAEPKKSKRPIPSRGFAKGPKQKIPSRPFLKRKRLPDIS